MAIDTSSGLKELRNARGNSRGLLIAVAIFSFFANLLMLTGPLFMLQVYDRVLSSRSEATLVALFVLVALLYSLMGAMDYARGRVLARFGARFQDTLDVRVFHAVLAQSVNPTSGTKSRTGLRDLETVQQLFSSPALLAIFDIPWTPIFILAIFVFHPWLGWMAVGGGVLLITLTILNQMLSKKRVNQAQAKSYSAHSLVDSAIGASEVLMSQGMKPAMTSRWKKVRDAGLTETIASSDYTGGFTSFSKAFRFFLQSAMLAMGAYLVLQNEMSAGAMIAGSILLGRALAPIEMGIGQWALIIRARQAWGSLSKLLAATPVEKDKMDLPDPKAQLSVNNLAVVVPGEQRPILGNITFDLQPGEVLGVIGKSGSGKSTLAKALIGLVPPAVGEIRLDGSLLESYNGDVLGKHIGYLPQSVSLLQGTVAENIARMSENPSSESVIAAARKAQAHELVLHLPAGYDTNITGSEGRLSGGQRQRLGLARAMYGDPAMLVLDEPNAALDADGSEALNAAVRDYKTQGKIVIIMTHRPVAIAECDKLLYLDAGRVGAYGPRDEVLQKIVKNNDTVSKAIRG